MMNNPKKLTKSRTNRVISGVAGGLGEYLNLDPLIFRILFVIFTFAGGFGALAYLILLIMIPADYSFPYQNANNNAQNSRTVVDETEYEVVDNHSYGTKETKDPETESQRQNTADFSDLIRSKVSAGRIISFSIGFLFILMGSFILFSKILHFSWWEFVFPVILLVTGIVFLLLSIHPKK